MLLLVALLILSLTLIVTGLALWSIPVALVTAGVLLGSVVLFVDFDGLKRKGGRR